MLMHVKLSEVGGRLTEELLSRNASVFLQACYEVAEGQGFATRCIHRTGFTWEALGCQAGRFGPSVALR